MHYYHYLKIIISIKGKFSCILNGQEISQLTGLIINQNVHHSINTNDSCVLIYFIDMDNSLFYPVQTLLHQKTWMDISDRISFQKSYDAPLNNSKEININNLASSLLRNVLPSAIQHPVNIDPRILSILEYIDQNIHKEVSLKDLANLIYLSPERTRHLFEEQTSIPFSQYILWKRIKMSIQALLMNNLSMGDVAIQNGFTDQSHFNKTFKRMFGATPKSILKKKTFYSHDTIDE